jgi:hypothetical protein
VVIGTELFGSTDTKAMWMVVKKEKLFLILFFFNFMFKLQICYTEMINFVTVHNKYSKIPPSASVKLCNWSAKIACCSSQLISTFLYAGSSIQNRSAQFVTCTHLSLVNFALNPTPQTKLWVGSVDSDSSVSVIIQNWAPIHMQFFSHNDRYYHLRKYWPFLPNHPVFVS